MPIIEVWQHPREKERIFMTKKEYLEELKEEAWYDYCYKQADKIADRLGMIIAKKVNHIKTIDDMLEFLYEYWADGFDWACYRDGKSPKKYIYSFNEITMRQAWSTAETYPPHEPLTFYNVHFDIDVYDEDGCLIHIHRMADMIRDVFGFYQGGGGRFVGTGKWHLLNAPAEADYAKEYEEWKANAVVARLTDNSTVEPFKFKGREYA